MKQTTYTPKEIASMVGVEPSTVYSWLSRGELRALKVGRNRLIKMEHLKEFYEYRRTGDFIDYTYAPKTR